MISNMDEVDGVIKIKTLIYIGSICREERNGLIWGAMCLRGRCQVAVDFLRGWGANEAPWTI